MARNAAVKFLPEFSYAKYPGEKHAITLDGKPFNYLGPGTALSKRENPDGSPTPGNEPISTLDQIAKNHDDRYALAGDDLDKQHEADLIMLEEIKNTKFTTLSDKLWAFVASKIISAKVKLGMGISEKILRRHGYIKSHGKGITAKLEGINFDQMASQFGSL